MHMYAWTYIIGLAKSLFGFPIRCYGMNEPLCQPNISTWLYTCIYVNVQVHTYAYVSVSCVCPYLCIPSPTKATCFFLKTKWAFHPLVSSFTWKTLLLYHSPSMETHYSWAPNLIIPCGRAIFTYLIFMLYVGSWKLWTWFLPSYLLQCLIIGSCSKTIFAIWMSEFCPYHPKCLISFIISAWKQVCGLFDTTFSQMFGGKCSIKPPWKGDL